MRSIRTIAYVSIAVLVVSMLAIGAVSAKAGEGNAKNNGICDRDCICDGECLNDGTCPNDGQCVNTGECTPIYNHYEHLGDKN